MSGRVESRALETRPELRGELGTRGEEQPSMHYGKLEGRHTFILGVESSSFNEALSLHVKVERDLYVWKHFCIAYLIYLSFRKTSGSFRNTREHAVWFSIVQCSEVARRVLAITGWDKGHWSQRHQPWLRLSYRLLRGQTRDCVFCFNTRRVIYLISFSQIFLTG